MRDSDFAIYGINYFSAQEIIETGAKLADISPVLFSNLNYFRIMLGQPVLLLKNGLTTGKHKSKEHRAGDAVDVYFQDDRKLPSISEVLFIAVKAGFSGVGIYHNGNAYSLHLDIGTKIRTWSAKKTNPKKDWTYSELIVNPKL